MNTGPFFIGPYQLFQLLGAGGMGEVYLARSPDSRLVALKVIRADYADSVSFRQRFAHEVDAARRVSGFFTPPVLDADTVGPQPWLATAYLPAPSLREVVPGSGVLGESALRALGAGLAAALQAIHAAGLVHRDLKPGNVLVAWDGPRVIGFGISAPGTPGYLAPEQIASGREIGPAADVFSLGCVLGFAATGVSPFDTGEPADLNHRVVHQAPNLAGVPESLRDLIAACLDKDPARRPPVAMVLNALAPADPAALLTPALRQDLDQRAQAASAVLSQPPVTLPPVPARPNRRRFFAIVAGVGALGVAGGTVAVVEAIRPRSRPKGPNIPPGPAPLWSWTAPTRFDSGSSLAMLGSILVWFGDENAYGVNPATGAPLWTTKPQLPTGVTVRSWLAAYGSVLYGVASVNSADYFLYGVDATGKEVVNVKVAADPDGHASGYNSIFGVGGGTVLAGRSDYYDSDSLVVAAVDLASGQEGWTRSMSAEYHSVTVADQRCYLQDDNATVALDLATGTQIWNTPNTLSSGQTSTLARTGPALVVVGHKAVGLDPATGKQLWTAVSESTDLSGPIVTPNRVYVGDDGGVDQALHALDPATGKQAWRAECPVSFVPASGYGAAGSSSGSSSVLGLSVLDDWSGVIVMRASDGSLLWVHKGTKSEAGHNPEWTVLVSGSTVYGASGTTLHAFRSGA